MLGTSPLVLVVHPSFPGQDGARADRHGQGEARRESISARAAVGTTPHMAGELFLFNAGIRMTHVSYRGEAPAITDLLAGHCRCCSQISR
jgi:tripartite-type tricarboxylate transporter receptor subunit TctC